MDKRIVLITIAGLIAANLSCTYKTGGQQKQQVEEKSCLASEESDSVQLSVCKKSKDFRMTEKDDCYVFVYKKPIENGVYCNFFITNGENGYRFMVYDSSKDRYYDINFNADSKEYASSEIETRYGNSLCNVKGLGIRRGEN